MTLYINYSLHRTGRQTLNYFCMNILLVNNDENQKINYYSFMIRKPILFEFSVAGLQLLLAEPKINNVIK